MQTKESVKAEQEQGGERMKAKYGIARKTCNTCNKYMWPIVVMRGGDKTDFIICSECGNKVV